MNLLQETIEILESNGKTSNDVLWVGNYKAKTTWANFAQIADVEYDNGYGAPQVAQDLLIVGDGFWLERHEYDGAEWWEYKEVSKEPENTIELKAVTVEQAEEHGEDVSCGWEDLFRLNGHVVTGAGTLTTPTVNSAK